MSSVPALTFYTRFAGVIWAQRDKGAFPPYKGVVGEDPHLPIPLIWLDLIGSVLNDSNESAFVQLHG